MKKLLIAMMAILAFNLSYAAELGEEMGIPNEECTRTRADAQRVAKDQIQQSREVQKDDTSSSSIDG